MRIDGFDWDHGNREKCHKHGLSVSEIEGLFRGDVRITPSLKPDVMEERHVAVGRTIGGRSLFVVFTIRSKLGHQLIRPISARYMHRKEIDAYEKESPKTENR